jgi:TPR repeat protein
MFHFLQEIHSDIEDTTPPKDAESFEDALKAAINGEAEAQYHVALYYDAGSNGVKRDPLNAQKWYTLAAQQDHATSCFFLARLFDIPSSGVVNDKNKARSWYKRAARFGNQFAVKRLKEL